MAEEGEAKDLSKVPKTESDEVKKSIIRTTIKNENLLAKKMENLKIRKSNQNKRKTSSLKHKLDRSDKLSGVLSTKIEQSIARAKYVQSARKSGWDQINKSITIKNDIVLETKVTTGPVEKSEMEIEKEEEDEYVKEFFGEDAEKEEEEESKPVSTGNVFALLDEAEA